MPKHVRVKKTTPFARMERMIAIAAVGVTAFGFAQPEVLSLAGLDFTGTSATAQGIDTTATGSIPLKPQLQLGTASPDQIHGLAGTLKPLRSRL